MNKELLRYAKRARTFLVCTVALGMLGASATIAQMALLSKVVDQVFLTGKSLDQVGTLLLLLLGAVVLRSGLLWLREVSAQRGAIFVKSELRERLFANLMRLHMQRQWSALSRMSAHFLDVLQGLPTLKAFGRSAAEREKVAEISDEFRDRTLKVLRYAFLSGFVLEFIATLSIALVAVTLGVRLLVGGISFEAAFLVLLLAPEFFRPLRELGVHRHTGMEGKAAAERIFEILGTPAPVGPGSRGVTRPEGQLEIELKDVGYSYLGSDRPALSGTDLTLPAGACTALVGRSGAGKSTLVNLLMRFADAEHGRITANGIPITDLSVEAWRENLALVPQRPYLFYGSVLENIRLARPAAAQEEIERAAGLAGAAEFIERLPRGYDTQIGERGARLSGGRRRGSPSPVRFLKDAPVLIMDESTSSLDPESERLIGDALERLMRDRTVLVIAHRLNTVYRADRVVVLEAGRLAEAGTHAELIEHGGPYAHLVNAYKGTLA
ncbi:MAG: ABC transporter ATP-binding protein/permease [Actinobacteria bacterium]|nr:ABC transporter ATP-binding protein/permease [Actinomycetota bacterium]